MGVTHPSVTFAFLSIMAVLCWMFVVFGISSFLKARKAPPREVRLAEGVEMDEG